MFKENNEDLRHRNIYRDKNKRYIYFNKRKKQGIVIPYEDLKRWQIMQMRILIPIIFLILSSSFWPEFLIIEIISAIIIAITLEIYNFNLKKYYIIIDNYKPDDQINHRHELAKGKRGMLVLRGVAFIILAVLLVITTLPFDTTKILENLVLYAVAIYALYDSFNSFMALRNK